MSDQRLTDEELAAMQKVGPDAADVLRLIADLRANRAMTAELAMALHQCSDYLPLFIEDGPRLERAQVVHERVQAALKAYCDGAGITRQELHRRAVVE